jgi:hypothetical protein
MILLPRFITNTCLLLKSNLTATQLGNCTLTSQRVYNRIDTEVLGIGPMTGANMLDASTAVLNLGLLTDNETIVRDALDHYYGQTWITPATGVDGIKVDGAYMQHFSQLYTGNYGKDFINSVVVAYIQSDGTSFAAPPASQAAFLTLMDGTEWLINSRHNSSASNSSLIWQYSVIGRMISTKVADNAASSVVQLNLTRVNLAVDSWDDGTVVKDIAQRLTQVQTKTSGQGQLEGTRGFYTSDYLVHRSQNYVTTWKAFSTRTSNSECNNDQNPFGFHMSDGAIFTYIDGTEYTDVFAAWDWNLVPGTTVDYGATPFGCNITQFYGNTSFVGSVTPSLNNSTFSTSGGMTVMQYLNPMTGNLRWEKTYYFFPGFYAVQIGPIYSQGTEPIITTLDQSNLKGDVYLDGELLTSQSTVEASLGAQNGTRPLNLWHNRVLYTILGNDQSATLKVNTASRTSNNEWDTIGISNGTATQPIFTATIEHPPAPLLEGNNNSQPPFTYIAQLNVDAKQTMNTESLVQFVYQDDEINGKVRGAYHVKDRTIALAFWSAGSYVSPWGLTVNTNQPILTFFTASSRNEYTLTVSDPTQLLTQVKITVSRSGSEPKELIIDLPQAPMAGKSVTVSLI